MFKIRESSLATAEHQVIDEQERLEFDGVGRPHGHVGLRLEIHRFVNERATEMPTEVANFGRRPRVFHFCDDLLARFAVWCRLDAGRNTP